jgi:hypothetical protein
MKFSKKKKEQEKAAKTPTFLALFSILYQTENARALSG